MCLCVCVQAPLESINPKSNRLTAEAAFDVCWIPLRNIGCCFHNIHFPFFCQEYIVLFFPDEGVIVQQDRWLLCYEFVYNPGVFSPVLWSVILHLWARIIPFLSSVSLLIFDPNLTPPHRTGQRGLRSYFSHLQIECIYFSTRTEALKPVGSFFFFFFQELSLRGIYCYIFLFICVLLQWPALEPSPF